jgi:soluble lytic murein transglycosylase-like protein
MSAELPHGIALLINDAAQKHDVAPELARAVAWVESRGNQFSTSPAGAKGVMQLMPDTAKGLGVVNIYDPASNIDGGVRFLKYLLVKYSNDVDKALAAYNWGPGHVDSDKTWPVSVQQYVHLVKSRMAHEMGRYISPLAQKPPLEVARSQSPESHPSDSEFTSRKNKV